MVAISGMLVLQFIYLVKLLENNKISSKVFNDETLEFSKTLVPSSIRKLKNNSIWKHSRNGKLWNGWFLGINYI